MLRGRASGRSTHMLAPGHIVLASDVAALSKANGIICLVENNPSGNRADGGDGARGMLSLGAVEWPLRWLAVVTESWCAELSALPLGDLSVLHVASIT